MKSFEVRPFEVVPVPTRGLISRLFARVPRKAALIELSNLLATTPLVTIREDDIKTVFAKSRLQPREASQELITIFEQAALLAAADQELSDADRRGLAILQRSFALTEAEATAAIESSVGQVFQHAMREALSDGTFTTQDKERLQATARALGLSDTQTKQLYNETAAAAVQAAFSNAISDERYTDDEEAFVTGLASSLGVTITHDQPTTVLVARYRLLARVESGTLPSLAVPILLKRGESCHFSGAAEHCQIKTVTKRINYSGPTASFKIIGSLRWRVGSISVQRVTSDMMRQIDTGVLYITSARLLFDGTKKNTSIPLGKIVNFTTFRDGLRVEKEAGPDQ